MLDVNKVMALNKLIQASNILIYEQSVAEQEDKFYIVT